MNDIALFDYQKEMLMRVREAFREHQSVMVQMPTGTGKTYLLAAVVELFAQRKVWIVAHRRELVSQIEDTVGRFYPGWQAEHIRVMSVQWLARHYREMKDEPSLIVIDEAHHAVADTYAEVMRAFPKARKLGLTATPYRMSGKGFADLFDVLLTSWSMGRFMAEGRLSLYDYYSIKPDSEDQLLIDSLKKRGADGDYQQKEMIEVMDVRPSLARLCMTMKQYVPEKKGIVYAISIAHAEHIAEYYREHGISAVAISSKTPSSLRKELLERFKHSSFTASSQHSSFSTSFSSHPVPLSQEGSTAFPKPPSPQDIGDVTSTPRRSKPLRSKAVGASRPSPDCLLAGALAGASHYTCCANHLTKKADVGDNEAAWASLSTLRSSLPIQVLVSVDLFSEGFDCPDVEFIQLARPTLSLSKYLQMVGRGLRVARGKDYCVILDNVGLYRRFGLPSADRDWQSMFEGHCSMMDEFQEACMRVNALALRMETSQDEGGEMTRIIGHDRQQQSVGKDYGYRIVHDGNGRRGIVDKGGKPLIGCDYADIELTDDGFAHCMRGEAGGGKSWVDLRNGVWFDRRPRSVGLLGLDFSTDDVRRLYPRIRSKFIDDKACLSVKTLELQVGAGLAWKRRFIPWEHPDKVYIYKENVNGLRLYHDDEGRCMAQENMGSPLVAVDSQERMDEMCRECAERRGREQSMRKELEETSERHRFTLTSRDEQKNWVMEGNSLARSKGEGGDIWIDLMAMKTYAERPTLLPRRGFVEILRAGEWCYVRNIPGLRHKPLREWEIVADDNICVINNEFLFLKQEPRLWYKVFRRTDDFSYFVVKEHEATYKDYIGIPDITITQLGRGGLKMEAGGVPYTPYFQPGLRSQ